MDGGGQVSGRLGFDVSLVVYFKHPSPVMRTRFYVIMNEYVYLYDTRNTIQSECKSKSK